MVLIGQNYLTKRDSHTDGSIGRYFVHMSECSKPLGKPPS